MSFKSKPEGEWEREKEERNRGWEREEERKTERERDREDEREKLECMFRQQFSCLVEWWEKPTYINISIILILI